MLTANAHKNTQGYCQTKKDSICYNLPQKVLTAHETSTIWK